MRGTAGQASLETIGLTTLVVTLVTGAAAYGAKPRIGDAVVRQFQRGICIVRAGDCERDRAPCVLASDEDGARRSVTVGIVRVDSDRSILVEELSDGTVRLTVVGGGGIGVAAGWGATAEFDFGKVAFGVGGELRAAVLASARAGGTMVLPSRKAAEQLRRWIQNPLELIRRPPRNWLRDPRKIFSEGPSITDEPPKGESVYGELGQNVRIGATGVVDPVIQGDVVLDAEDALGVRRNVRSGNRTFYYRRGQGIDAALGVGPEGMREIAGFGRRESTIYGVEVDRDGRPVDFSVSTIEKLGDVDDLPSDLRDQARVLVGAGQRALVTERHLDLTVADNLEAVKAFMSVIALRRGVFGAIAPIVSRLSGRLDEQATYSARAYRVSADGSGAAGSIGAGAKVGIDIGNYDNTSELLAALERGPSGAWDASSFCG